MFVEWQIQLEYRARKLTHRGLCRSVDAPRFYTLWSVIVVSCQSESRGLCMPLCELCGLFRTNTDASPPNDTPEAL